MLNITSVFTIAGGIYHRLRVSTELLSETVALAVAAAKNAILLIDNLAVHEAATTIGVEVMGRSVLSLAAWTLSFPPKLEYSLCIGTLILTVICHLNESLQDTRLARQKGKSAATALYLR
jgi:hypothetical protein